MSQYINLRIIGWPSTFTQPLIIQRSASRREHRPSSPMRLERRGCSGFTPAATVDVTTLRRQRLDAPRQKYAERHASDAQRTLQCDGRLRYVEQTEVIDRSGRQDLTQKHG